MRNLLALVGFTTVTFLGLGWFMGWYKVGRNPNASTDLQIGIDTKKVTQDVQRGVKGVTELINSVGSKDNSSSWYDPTPATPAPLPPTTLAPVVTQRPPSWYDPTPVPPATAKPGWQTITPVKR